jgi:hypothetical protein
LSAFVRGKKRLRIAVVYFFLDFLLTKVLIIAILLKVIKMEVIQRDNLLREIKPFVKEMVEDIVAESFKKGEMKELFADLLLAQAMEETEEETNLSNEDALKQIKWK